MNFPLGEGRPDPIERHTQEAIKLYSELSGIAEQAELTVIEADGMSGRHSEDNTDPTINAVREIRVENIRTGNAVIIRPTRATTDGATRFNVALPGRSEAPEKSTQLVLHGPNDPDPNKLRGLDVTYRGYDRPLISNLSPDELADAVSQLQECLANGLLIDSTLQAASRALYPQHTIIGWETENPIRFVDSYLAFKRDLSELSAERPITYTVTGNARPNNPVTIVRVEVSGSSPHPDDRMTEIYFRSNRFPNVLFSAQVTRRNSDNADAEISFYNASSPGKARAPLEPAVRANLYTAMSNLLLEDRP